MKKLEKTDNRGSHTEWSRVILEICLTTVCSGKLTDRTDLITL